jgi:AcrR family transcriptional regulator
VREIAASVGIKAASLYAHCPGGKEQMLRMGLHNILSQFLAYITQDIRFEWAAQKQLSSVFERHIMWQLEFGDQALAWDAAINQFGVVGVLDDDALAAIRSEQSLYHDYLDELVATVMGDPDTGDTATALRVMCDQAPAWLTAESPGRAEIDDVIARLRPLAARLLGTASL